MGRVEPLTSPREPRFGKESWSHVQRLCNRLDQLDCRLALSSYRFAKGFVVNSRNTVGELRPVWVMESRRDPSLNQKVAEHDPERLILKLFVHCSPTCGISSACAQLALAA